MMGRARYAGAALVALALGPGALSAQIAEAVGRTDRGVVRFSFETRPGVEICENGIRWNDGRSHWTRGGEWERRTPRCVSGVAEVELDVRDGRVHDVDVLRLDEGSRSARDLGEVPAGEAAGFLLSLAWRGSSGDAAEDALFPAMIADVDGTWQELVVIARDREVRRDVRKQALFWLGQEAAEAATADLADVASDESEDQEVRNSAVFALSQREDEESISALIEIAETAAHPETRKTAMFWLAQSEDPRVLQFFEDILLGKGD